MFERILPFRCLIVLLPAAILLVSSSPASELLVSSVPVKDAARINLRDTYTGALIWYYNNPGDYNQDGIVNASDITPLGYYFGAVAESNGLLDSTGFWEGSAQWLIDGDHNGVINSADITPIGANFGNDVLGGFNVYESDSLDGYPPSNAGVNVPGARLLGHIDLAEAISASGLRLEFTFQVEEPSEVNYYWIRPLDKDGHEGTPSSTIVQLGRKVPLKSRSAALASWTTEANTLEWLYFNAGDYNQDGVVRFTDITPVGVYFNQQSPEFPTPWPATSIESVIDGNADGVIDMNDMVIIGQNMDRRVEGYNIYASLDPLDYPEAEDAFSKLEPLLADISYADFFTYYQRTKLYVVIEDHFPGTYYWMRPYDYLGYEGTPSNLVDTSE